MWHFWITRRTKIFPCLVCIVFWFGNENNVLVFPMGWKHHFPVISSCGWLIQEVNDERATNDGIKERMTKGLPRRPFEEMQRQVMENESFMVRRRGASRWKCGHLFVTITSENCSQGMSTAALWKQAYALRPQLYAQQCIGCEAFHCDRTSRSPWSTAVLEIWAEEAGSLRGCICALYMCIAILPGKNGVIHVQYLAIEKYQRYC